jgi:mono/diheme cytochrome c family protein
VRDAPEESPTVKRLRVPALIAAACLGVSAYAAEMPNLERGRALYENHCVVCHTPKVHRRVPSLAIEVADLRYIVTLWATQQNLRWSREDIEDVVHYLDYTHYRLLR